MATDVITTIGATSSPTTPDYSTLQAWEDAITANLVTADQRHIGECLDQGVFTHASGISLLIVDGHTTDATRNIILRCATGASFRDKSDARTSALYYDETTGQGVAIRTGNDYAAALQLLDSYTQVVGLQLKKVSANTNSGSCIFCGVSSETGILIDSCLMQTNSRQCVDNLQGTILNSLLVVTISSTSVRAIKVRRTTSEVHGCTIIQTTGANGAAFGAGYGGTTIANIRNCAVFGFGSFIDTLTATASTYNATDLASGAGTSSLTSLTFADQVENTASDYRAVSSGDLLAGTADSTNLADDIVGYTRAATPTIGCWELAAAAAGSFHRVIGGCGGRVIAA